MNRRKDISDREVRKYILLFVYISLFAWVLDKLGFSAALSIRPFNGFFANGSFQVLNPLRRIADGQALGVDFQFFHGMLIPYLIYPVYKFFGGDLYGAEVSRYFVTFIATLTALGTFYLCLIRRWYFVIFLAIHVMLFREEELWTPSNSLGGLRACFPLIFAALLLLPKGNRWRILIPIVLLLAVGTSTEHGVALVTACMVACVAYIYLYRELPFGLFLFKFGCQMFIKARLLPLLHFWLFLLKPQELSFY